LATSTVQIIKQPMLAAEVQFGPWSTHACYLQPVKHWNVITESGT